MIERLREIGRESDARTKRLVEEQNKIDIRNFDAVADVEMLPYEDRRYFFIQQGMRIIWMRENDRYCAARYYPNKECAAEVIEELNRKGLTTNIEVWKQ